MIDNLKNKSKITGLFMLFGLLFLVVINSLVRWRKCCKKRKDKCNICNREMSQNCSKCFNCSECCQESQENCNKCNKQTCQKCLQCSNCRKCCSCSSCIEFCNSCCDEIGPYEMFIINENKVKEILEETVENDLKKEIEEILDLDKKKYIGASDATEELIYKLCPKEKQNPGTPAGQRDQAASSQGENIPLQDMAPGSDQSQGGDVRPAARSRDDDAGSSQTVPRSASQIQRKTCSIM